METIPSPIVINVDFKTKPDDEAARPFPPEIGPAQPAPFRKRTSLLPARFFSPRRLPTVTPPAAVPDEGDALTAHPAEAGAGAARLILPPLPPETPAAPVDLPAAPPVQAAAEPEPLPEPTPEPLDAPLPPPAVAAADAPEPAADLPVPAPEPPVGAPAAALTPSSLLATPAPMPEAPAPQPPAAPATDPGSRSGERGASVQLTLSCEVAALRLTPSFRLGDVRLRTLSEVVSLRLVAPRDAENPFAAAVAFQIVHVELDPVSRRLKNLLLKPLDEPREAVTPRPRLQVAEVGLTRGGDGGGDPHGQMPITVTAAASTSTTVQVLGTFHLGSIHFTPRFGVGTLRLELASDTVQVRVTPSTLSAARDLPPAFDLAEAELDAGGRLAGLRLTTGK